MALKRGGLGKGLDAIFMENFTESKNQTIMLNISEIEPNELQPRKHFDEETLAELADSISKYGLLQPLLVRPIDGRGYQIVAGERRWRACRMAGIKEIPVSVRKLSDLEVAEFALIENLQREDLNPVEEAMGYQLLLNKYSLKKEEVALAVGKSRSSISNIVRILSLPQEVLKMVEIGILSGGHARTLLSLKNTNRTTAIAQIVAKRGMSVRELEKLCRRENELKFNVKQSQKQSTRLAFYDHAEQELRNFLCGHEARICTKKDNKGTLEIDFNNEDELKDIFKTLDIF